MDPARGVGGVVTTTTAPAIPGTSLVPGILRFIEGYYAVGCADQTIPYFFDALYGFDLSPNAGCTTISFASTAGWAGSRPMRPRRSTAAGPTLG